MEVIIHGGAGQIGGNCIEVISGETRIILDLGIPITNIDGTEFEEPRGLSGKELFEKGILPDVKGLYEWDKPEITAILLSHYHCDHYGWVKYAHRDIPCYLGEVSHRLIEIMGIMNKDWKNIIKNPVYIKSWEPFSIGNIKVSPFLMDHSACDSYMFVLEGEGKRIVYTGDFRSHGRKGKLFKSFLDQCPMPVNLLITEGTCLSESDRRMVPEEELEEKISEVCKETEGFVFGFTSSQNIDRVVSFYKGALRNDRVMVIDPYEAYVLDMVGWKVPKADGNYKVKVMYPRFISDRISETGNEEILYRYKKYKITKKELGENPGKYLILVRSSMLSDMKYLGDLTSSKLIYSMWQGYKEKNNRFLKVLEELGVKIVDVHSSGHGGNKTIKELIHKLNPEKILPIHTEKWEEFRKIGDNVIEAKKGLMIKV